MRLYKVESIVKIFPFQDKLYKDVKINWLLSNAINYELDSNCNKDFTIKMNENLNLFLPNRDSVASTAYWLNEKGFDTKVVAFDTTDIPFNIAHELKGDYFKVLTNADALFLLHLQPEVNGYISSTQELLEINTIEPLIAELQYKFKDIIDVSTKHLIYSSLRNSFSCFAEHKRRYSEINDFFEQYYKRAFVNPYFLR